MKFDKDDMEVVNGEDIYKFVFKVNIPEPVTKKTVRRPSQNGTDDYQAVVILNEKSD